MTRRFFVLCMALMSLTSVAASPRTASAGQTKPSVSKGKPSPRPPRVFTNADKAWATKALKHLAHGGYNDGDTVHNANAVLGLVALQDGRVADAKAYLLKAGATTGSPVLGSFGPSMLLARRLVEHGERKVVLQYLDQVEKFWIKPRLYYVKQAAEVWTKPSYSVAQKKMIAAPGNISRFEALQRDHEKQLAEWRVLVRQGKVPIDWLWNLDPPQR